MQDDDQKNHRSVPAVSRAIAIMRLLGQSQGSMGINQIARELDLVPSTCLHILRVLANDQLVAFDPVTKRYTLGVGILSLARRVISQNDFAAVAQPWLTDLSERFGVTLIAVEMAGRGMVVVSLAQSAAPFRLQVDLGSRFPAFISASGRCFAAFGGFDEEELKTRFATLKWDEPPQYAEWRAQVEATRERGYGLDEEQYIVGVTILAAPFFDHAGHVNRSLVAAGISEKINKAGVAALAAEMLRARDEISELLVTGAAGGRARKAS